MDISVKNLVKTYGPQRAVDDISFEVKTGEILGFLGPNGAGKTTTMKVLTCYMAPTEGMVRIGNLDIFEDADEIKRHIGYLPESNPLYQEMPVLEFLSFVADVQDVPKKKFPSGCAMSLGNAASTGRNTKKSENCPKDTGNGSDWLRP
jgi:ABC-2 type transport system ATP-binding protein